MIVLALFVIMWALSGYEIRSKNKLIQKLNKEYEDVLIDYNQLVTDYNDAVDFLEKHFTKEQLDELFLEHDMDKFIGEDGNMNEQMRETIKQHLRDNIDKR
jgi:hypothetical protein